MYLALCLSIQLEYNFIMKNIVSIQLNTQRPKYLQIAEQIEQKIIDAELLPGERLPAIRNMAKELGVNSITVVKAYELLQGKRLVTKIKGSGVYVGTVITKTEHERISLEPPLKEVHVTDLNNDELYLDDEIDLMQQGNIIIRKDAINFATSTPTSDIFPVAPFKQAINEVLDRDGGAAFEYDESNGYLPLRETVSDMLASTYGITTPVERLQIISGAQQGIDIVAKALITPGDRVLVEDPTYTGALAVFKSRGAQIVGIPMQNDGIDIDHLKKSIEFYKPRVLYVMPDFQNPTTCSYSAEKRQMLINLAHRHDIYIIEDDYLSDLSFSSTPRPKAIKTYEEPSDERVIYIKSFSKLLMPGLRIGFLTAPKALFRDILQAKHLTDITSSGLIQRTFNQYLRSGVWEEHLRQIRAVYRTRYTAMLQSINTLLPTSIGSDPPEGGFNFWIRLPAGVSASELYLAAAREGVLCTPGNVFRAGQRSFDDHIRLSIAAVHQETIAEGIQILSDTISQLPQEENRNEFLSPLM